MPPQPATRIAVLDGNASLAGVLAELLADEPGFVVAGTGTTGLQAMALARDCGADVFIVDERLDDALPADVLAALREHCPSAAVLLWSHHELHTAVEGVDAVLPRGITFRELVRGIRAVQRRRRSPGRPQATAEDTAEDKAQHRAEHRTGVVARVVDLRDREHSVSS